MSDSFQIPVIFNQSALSFSAKLLKLGYTHKIQVEVNGLNIIFEPDEEGNYRAIINDIPHAKAGEISIPLLKAIASAIESILK